MAVGAGVLMRRVVLELKEPLARLGFQKRSGPIFTVTLAPEVLGWLGLNRAFLASMKTLEINPVIGLRHQEIERVVAECRNAAFHPYVPPTISSSLGYVTPAGSYVPWLFNDLERLDETADHLAHAIEQYGIPFIREGQELSGVLALMDRGLGLQLAYTRPVAYLLAGDSSEAERVLDASVANVRDRDDPAAQDFRAFATRLHGRIALSG
ncbi:MAG: hypothetical protein NVS4B2_27690 [Chloroflexota bacterium]